MSSKHTPRKKPANSVGTAQSFKDKYKFVNISLNAADKSSLSEAVFEPDTLASFITRQAESGYKLSFSLDKRNDAFTVSMTGQSCVEENKHKILTARGSTLENAFLSLLYKWEVYCYEGIFPGQSDDTVDDFG